MTMRGSKRLPALADRARRCAITRRSAGFMRRAACTSPEDLCPACGEAGCLRFALACRLVAWRSGPAARRRRSRRQPPSKAEDRRRVHRQDQGAPAGSADLDRAGRSPAGLGHRADAAEVLQPHRRHAGRADLREGHLPLLRRARQGVRPHHDVAHRQDRGRPRHGAAGGGGRGDDQAARQVQGDGGVADRSAQDDRAAGAAADQDRQADLLDHERHALDRDRRARDADRAAVPAGGRGNAVHPGDPQQRHHAHHAGDRSRRPREAGRHLLLQQEAPRRRAISRRCR